jgi:hypothetical protein
MRRDEVEGRLNEVVHVLLIAMSPRARQSPERASRGGGSRPGRRREIAIDGYNTPLQCGRRQRQLAFTANIDYNACTQPHETGMTTREANPQMRALA